MPRWQREILRSSDADVRRDVGRYILAARKPPASAVPGVGAVVEFARGGRLHCGIVWPHVARGRSLLIVGVAGEETWIRRDKVIHVSVQKISTDTRSVAIRALQQTDALRRDLQDSIDMPTLWEIALESAHSGEDSIWSTGKLTDLYFSGAANGDQRAALLRSLYTGDWFTRRGTGWLAITRATVERRRCERQRRDDEERNLEVAAAWLRAVADGRGEPQPPQAEGAITLLEQVVLHGKESADAHQAARLMAKAHLHGPLSARQILVALGHWDEDENLDLHRLGVPIAFGESALAQVDEMVSGGVIWSTTASSRRRLWGALSNRLFGTNAGSG